MTLPASITPSEAQLPAHQTNTNFDLSNIDPILHYQSQPQPQDSSVLLNRGLEGFIFNPGPSFDPRASDRATPIRPKPIPHTILAPAPSDAIDTPALAPSSTIAPTPVPSNPVVNDTSVPLGPVAPVTSSQMNVPTVHTPAPEFVTLEVSTVTHIMSAPEPITRTMPAPEPQAAAPAKLVPDLITPRSVPFAPKTLLFLAHTPRSSAPTTTAPIPSKTVVSGQSSDFPTKTATLMASLISDYTLRSKSAASEPTASGSTASDSRVESSALALSDLPGSNTDGTPLLPAAELMSAVQDSTVVEDAGGAGRDLTAAEKRAITRAKNKANKRPRWEYVAVEDEAPADKYQKLLTGGRTLRTRSGSRI